MLKRHMKVIRWTLGLLYCLIELAGAQDRTWLLISSAPRGDEVRLDTLWNVEIVNPETESRQVSLVKEITEDTRGIIFRGTSNPITISPGCRRIGFTDISGITENWINPDFERAMGREDRLPEGNYRICMTVFSAENRRSLCTNCIRTKVSADHAEPQTSKQTKQAGSKLLEGRGHGTITVTYPTGSTVFHNSTDQQDPILWTCEDVANDSVRIDLIPCWDDDIALQDITITSGTENDGKYTWDREYPDNAILSWPYAVGKYQVRVTADIAKKIYGESDTILFDYPICELDLMLPNDGDELCALESCNFIWTPKSVSGQVPIVLSVTDMNYGTELLNKTVWNTGSYEWSIPSALGSSSLKEINCRVEIASEDGSISDKKYITIRKNCSDIIGVWQILYDSNPNPTDGPIVVSFRGTGTSGTAYYLDSDGSYTVSGSNVSWKTKNSNDQYVFSGKIYSADTIKGTLLIYWSGVLKFTESLYAIRVSLPK